MRLYQITRKRKGSTRMRWARLASVIVALWWLLALPVLAQTTGVRIEDPDTILGSGVDQVRAAAGRLAAEGAEVIVVAAGPSVGVGPGNPSAVEAYLLKYLNEQRLLLNSGGVKPNQIIFFVAPAAEVTLLRFGTQWRSKLDPVYQQIINQQMNPRFASGDLAGGFVAGIDAVRTTINPPISPAVYVIGGVLAVTALGVVLVPMLRRRRAAADVLAGARERMEQARRAAGGAIADLGQLVRQADAKDDYDRLSYSQDDVQRLQQIQGSGMQQFVAAQAAFDAAEEQQTAKATLRANDYDAIAAQYAQSQQLTQQAAAQIREAEAMRAALDARGKSSTGPTRRLGE